MFPCEFDLELSIGFLKCNINLYMKVSSLQGEQGYSRGPKVDWQDAWSPGMMPRIPMFTPYVFYC